MPVENSEFNVIDMCKCKKWRISRLSLKTWLQNPKKNTQKLLTPTRMKFFRIIPSIPLCHAHIVHSTDAPLSRFSSTLHCAREQTLWLMNRIHTILSSQRTRRNRIACVRQQQQHIAKAQKETVRRAALMDSNYNIRAQQNSQQFISH